MLVRFQPDFAPHDFLIVVDRHGCSRPTILGLTFTNLVSVIEIVVAGADPNFQPAITVLAAGKQRAVGAGNLGALRVRNRVTDVVSRGILGA